ncbi:MAG: ATP-binding cassette domain-containing protein [Methanomassiliicoccaceae archaeon]|nr:ATP-binding cassette domain-containing protein [Methanomassiliicoccaceae archaeon]
MDRYAVEFGNVSLVRNGIRIIDNVSMRIPEGESAAIIGPNGSGKTSLMKLLKGDSRPYYSEDSETVCRLFGKDRWNLFDLRNRMGVVSTELQSRFKDTTSAGEVILSGFFRTTDIYRTHTVTDEMIVSVKDAAARAGVEDKLTMNIGKLSLGEMRRVLIARALVPRPSMLLLDEPMTGLDIVSRDQFKGMFDTLIESGTGVLMITHSLEDIPKNIRRIIMMKNGKIYKDGMKDDVLTSATVSDLFSSEIEVTEKDGVYQMRVV